VQLHIAGRRLAAVTVFHKSRQPVDRSDDVQPSKPTSPTVAPSSLSRLLSINVVNKIGTFQTCSDVAGAKVSVCEDWDLVLQEKRGYHDQQNRSKS